MAYIGGYGGVIFRVTPQEILTPNRVSRKTKARYQNHAVINAVSKLEFTGADASEITFEVQLHESLGVKVEESLKMLREVCRMGLADYLIIGGANAGSFVLESVEETVEHTDGRGRTISATAKLTLKEYDGGY